MARYNSFEEIPVWQEARVLIKKIYLTTSDNKFKKDFGLISQMQRAAVSIMANIAEGFERNSDREFIRFLLYSKSSCGELRSHLYVALDVQYLSEEEFKELQGDAITLSKKLSGFIKYLKS